MAVRCERGAATLLVVSLLGVLLLIGSTLGAVGAVIADHRRAQSAADLAALAAARALADGGDACAAGAQVAAANGADLTSCAPSGREVTVRVEVSGPSWLGRVTVLDGQARAGPVD